jgi:hypothetical protein
VSNRGLRAAGVTGLAIAALGMGCGASAQASTRTGVAVNQIDAVPAGAKAGSVYTLHGQVSNTGRRAAKGRVTVRLLHMNRTPRAIGRKTVRVAAHATRAFSVKVRIPSGLSKGSYQLAACSPRGVAADPGLLTCATGANELQVDGGDAVRGPEAAKALAAPAAAAADVCSSGAHTLSPPGERVYPEAGNGGYKSVHTDTNIIYDAPSNLFLAGTHVDQTILSTQCLTDFSFDFERANSHTSGNPAVPDGPNMTVDSVLVNGQPATFKFVQPTYPGDPNGQDDPDPLAHAQSLTNPVGGTPANPNPPACSPPSNAAAQQGVQCPANKLVITPSAPVPAGTTLKVTINYSGRPGVHVDGDGSTEGWFRSNVPAGDGAMVTSEPLGTEAWMPLNNHPTAKPTYDFTTTTNIDRTSISNGELVSKTTNPTDPQFPATATQTAAGSVTWKWHSPEPIQNYLVENSTAFFNNGYDDGTHGGVKIGANGTLFYEFQSAGITAAKQASNKTTMDQQEDITNFQSTFNGPFPFSSDGIIVALPTASFEEEMQTKIVFVGGSIGPTTTTFAHENMHQWWGDNVAASLSRYTYLKEGMATIGEYLNTARAAAITAGGIGTPAGDAAFENSLIAKFNSTQNYGSTGGLWTSAPSNPTSATLFSTPFTYTRPGTSYVALRAILGGEQWKVMLKGTQHDFGGGNISEAQMEAQYKKYILNQSPACAAKLDTFFTQWWDTAYPNGGGLNKPQITGPGLAGPGFYDATGACSKQFPPVTTAAVTGTLVGDTYAGSPRPTLSFSAPDDGAGVGSTVYNLDGAGFVTYTGPVTLTDGTHTVVFHSLDAQGNQEADKTQTFKVDATGPVTTATVAGGVVNAAGGFTAVAGKGTVTLTAVDALNGVAKIEYSIDGGPFVTYSAPFDITGGGLHTLQYRATDTLGNVEATRTLNVLVDPTATGPVSGTVASTLSLTLGTPATFGNFTPGLTKDYGANMTATVVSTAGDALLSVADPSATATGHLVNGAFSLPSVLQAKASSNAGVGNAFANVGGSAAPTSLLTYAGPTSNDAVTVAFLQHIGSTDALRTGSYSKTLTFTLSTTTP